MTGKALVAFGGIIFVFVSSSVNAFTSLITSIAILLNIGLDVFKKFDFALVFTARRNARIVSAVLAMAFPSVCLSVRPSVRPSHAGIVSKRRQVARCSLHCWIAKCV